MKRTHSSAFVPRSTREKKRRRTSVPYSRTVPYRGLGIEKKYFDTTVAAAAVPNGGSIKDSLNLIPQGTTDVTRIANKVTLRNINLHMSFSLPTQAIAAPLGDKVRVILYMDQQANGATAAVTDILKTATIDSFRNMDQVERFVILKDKTFDINIKSQDAAAGSAVTVKGLNISKKCGYNLHFSSTTGAITELRSNNIGLLMISFLATAQVQYIARVKFTDD